MSQNMFSQEELNRFQAIILAGGRGTRLSPLTDTTPKPLLRIKNRPIIDYLIDQLRLCNLRDITIVVRYCGDQISKYLGDKHNCVTCDDSTMIGSFVFAAKKSSKDYLVGLS